MASFKTKKLGRNKGRKVYVLAGQSFKFEGILVNFLITVTLTNSDLKGGRGCLGSEAHSPSWQRRHVGGSSFAHDTNQKAKENASGHLLVALSSLFSLNNCVPGMVPPTFKAKSSFLS